MMQKSIYLLLLIAIPMLSTAQNTMVNIQIKELTSSTVTVTLPVNETYFFLNKKSYTIDKDSSITIQLQLSKAVPISCEGHGIIIEPGNNFIIIDKRKEKFNAIKYIGKNESGQRLFKKWHPVFYQNLANQYYKKDTTPAGVKKLIKVDEAITLQPFDSLLKAGKITTLFYSFVKNSIQTYYASVMAHIPLSLYFANMRKNKEPYLSKEYQQFWKSVYEDYPVMNHLAITSGSYYDYAMDYNTYKNLHIIEQKLKENKPVTINTSNDFMKLNYNFLDKQFKGLFKEYMLAHFIGIEMLQDDYQPVLTALFSEFTKAYPKSNFTPGLQPLADKILAFNEQAIKTLTPEQILVKDYENINSLEELLAIYKNQPLLYIDIWATWCGPCKGEFDYNKELKEALKNTDITFLYISMDDAKAESQWKNMITFYNLTGNHLRASKSLKQDLINKLWKGNSYAIPRYLIVKNGKIIDNDALRPSDKEKLYLLLKNSKK